MLPTFPSRLSPAPPPMWSLCPYNPYWPLLILFLMKSLVTSVLPNLAENLTPILLVTISSKCPWLLGQWSSSEPREERDAALGHYQPTSSSAGGMRTSVPKKEPGKCPPHASNIAGPKPSSLGPNQSTLKMCPDCHCPVWSSPHLLTRLMCHPPSQSPWSMPPHPHRVTS